MITTSTEAATLLESLVSQLVAEGHLTDSRWMDAFRAMPRHVFVPRMLVGIGERCRMLSGNNPEQRREWLAAVYSDDSLVTQQLPHAAGHTLSGGAPVQLPTSSSTMPSLMARMLEALDVSTGDRVLEIGTGTGYNAALLCHRLGEDSVISVDIDPRLVDSARQRLAEVDLHPRLVVGDGVEGAAAHGPYDRIIATAAVPEIPLAWIRQLTPGGKILANVRGNLAGGTCSLLTKRDGDPEVIGPVLPLGGHFMWLRPALDSPHRPHEISEPPGRSEATRTTTRLDATELVDDEDFRFLLQLQLPGARTLRRCREYDPRRHTERPAVVISASDGSHAAVFLDQSTADRRQVVQHPPRRLWDTIETTHDLWHELGKPSPDRFGIVANDTTQFVWFDTDDSWHRWPLPLFP